MTDIVFNEDQKKGFDEIVKFVESNKSTDRTLVLKGYAGTGKTTLIQEVTKKFAGHKAFCFTAPTNKATKVLMEMSSEQNSGVSDIMTIHRLLGLVMSPDGSVKVLRKKGSGDAVANYNVVVIDECSMVSAQLMEHIDDILDNHRHLKIIYMGDPMQLPPINEEESLTFTKAQHVVELKSVVRQADGSPIIKLCSDIRMSIEQGRTLYELKSERGADGKGIFVLQKPKFIEWMKKAYSSNSYATDPKSFKTIAWRNAVVDKANRQIRRAIYPLPEDGSYLDKFMLNERVVVASPVMDMLGEVILAHTDSEGVVESLEIIDAHPWLRAYGKFKVYRVVVKFFGLGPVECFLPHEDSQKDINKQLNRLSSEAKKDSRLWGAFWSFKEAFHDLRYAHAITSHRSQGSTYDNVFVYHSDIMSNRNKTEALKSLYVACSRARSNLIILE